jgi:hypothetical protein
VTAAAHRMVAAARGLALVAAAAAGACDPVHAAAKAALGGEAPGVSPGPLHRPGQPCLVCHDGAAGDPPAFSVAGTVYLDALGLVPVDGAAVILRGADQVVSPAATTNAAGNFYFVPGQFAPVYPFVVDSITVGNVAIAMHSHIGGNGSCAGCHVDPPGPDSPGHVYFDAPPGMTP